LGKAWSSEAWRLIVAVVIGCIAGQLLGAIAWTLLFTISFYLGIQLYHLRAMVLWLSAGGRGEPPDARGLWGEVFHQLYRVQQRHLKRQRKLGQVVNRFQEATSAMPDATVVLGAHNEIQWFNEAARGLLGLHPAKDRGQRIDNLVRHPGFAALLNGGDPSSGSLLMPADSNDGTTLSVRVIPYGNEQRLLIARDVSHQLRLEQMRRDFVANVSHELRTPLTVVSGCAETMMDADDPCIREWGRPLRLVQQQANRMQQIVEDLLLLSRLETDRSAPPRDPVVVPAMLAAIREDAELLSGERNHQIRLECDPALRIYGVEKQLHSAFSNLVSNAVRYTPANGSITMRWYLDVRGAHFEVTDTGPGIAEEHIPRLTERFYRVDVGRSRESGGTGLGLAIVKHVLTRYGTPLRIQSQVGKGSTFACDFGKEWIVSHDSSMTAREAS